MPTNQLEALYTDLLDYADEIVADYARFASASPYSSAHATAERIAEFKVTFEEGRKFIKVVTNHGNEHRSVHSFIIKEPTKGFAFGDIAKAASWKAPALNFPRGNVVAGQYGEAQISWAGCS
jgi:hypothetical protein